MAVTGAAAAGVAGLAPTANAGAGATTDRYARPFADAAIAALRKHRIVAIGEIHGQQEHYDAMQTLLFDPRLRDLVDDIVVEFGNALYQPTMDRFVNGEIVEDRDLRLVWRNTTQSPSNTWDAPMHEQFFRAVRAAGENVRDSIAATFAEFDSASIQELVHEMGVRLLDSFDELEEVSFLGENRLWDTARVLGADERVRVYTDPRPPFGQIELTLRR